jgi:phosphatidate cytidylyltransferase
MLLDNIKSIFANITNKENSNFKKRVISSIILIPIALISIFVSQSLFFILILSSAIIAIFEWQEITANSCNPKKWRLIAFIYFLIPIYSIIELRIIDKNIIIWMFFVVWATDIFAYIVGKNFGGPKLIPKISPNKTWSGLVGAVVASGIIGAITSIIFEGSILFFVFFSAILSIISQIGDIFESKVKRIFNVKDSGTIIPGHGGVLDRIDGIMFVAPVILIIYCLFQGNF